MKTSISIIVIASTLALSATLALADKMPKGATPLTTNEIKTIYADHTAQWGPTTAAYFGADGTVRGYFENRWVFWGKTTQAGNEQCAHNQGMDSKTKKSNGKITTDFWKWVKDPNGKLWTLYTKAYDNHKLDLVNGWYNEMKKLKPGNLVAAKYTAMGGP